MANGLYCKYCGCCETEHKYSNSEPEKRIEGYRHSLAQCGGFTLSRADQRRNTRIEEKILEEEDLVWRVWRAREEMQAFLYPTLAADFAAMVLASPFERKTHEKYKIKDWRTDY